MRVPVPWVFVISYLAGALVQRACPVHLAAAWSRQLEIIGFVLFGAGAVSAIWCQVIFRRARTTTVPGQLSSRLIANGPYQVSRNPMYVGLIIAYLGEAAILNQIWPVLFLVATVLYLNTIVIPVEESRLRQTFGDEYLQYCARVRRWI